MEDNFNQNEFEDFLREQVRNHRMYPTDTVWRDINKKLHGDKKWPALSIGAFTLLTATIAICVHFTPKPDLFSVKPANAEIKNSTLRNSTHNIVLENLASARDDNKQNGPEKTFKNPLPDEPAVSTGVYNLAPRRKLAEGISISGDRPVGKQLAENSQKPFLDEESLTREHDVAIASLEKSTEYNSATIPIIENAEIGAAKKIRPLTENQHLTREYNDKNMVDAFLK